MTAHMGGLALSGSQNSGNRGSEGPLSTSKGSITVDGIINILDAQRIYIYIYMYIFRYM